MINNDDMPLYIKQTMIQNVTTKFFDSISMPLFVCEQMPLNYIDSLKEICLNIGLLEASLDGADLSCFAVLVQPSTKM